MSLTLSLVRLIGSAGDSLNIFVQSVNDVRSIFDALSALSLTLYTYIMPNFRPLAADVTHILHRPSALGISRVSYV